MNEWDEQNGRQAGLGWVGLGGLRCAALRWGSKAKKSEGTENGRKGGMCMFMFMFQVIRFKVWKIE